MTVRRQPDAFALGRDCQRYVERYLDSQRIAIAAGLLIKLIEEALAGKVGLDIGAGRGLFSLCAYRAGTTEVISIDVDQDCQIRRQLRAASGEPEASAVPEGARHGPGNESRQLARRLPVRLRRGRRDRLVLRSRMRNEQAEDRLRRPAQRVRLPLPRWVSQTGHPPEAAPLAMANECRKAVLALTLLVAR